MNNGLVLRVLCCLAVFALYLYHIIQKQNTLNYLSMQIPKINKDLKALEEDNIRLQFSIDCFESPDHLMQLVKLEEHSHLHYPVLHEVFNLAEGIALHIEEVPEVKTYVPFKTQPVLAVGATH